MIITAVEDTTDCRLAFRQRILAQAPVNHAGTQRAAVGVARAGVREIGPGQAWSRAVDQVMRENCSVIASDALKMAMIAPTVTMSTTVSPNALRTTSVSGVGG